MVRPDDSSLSAQQYARVREEAERLLHKADALGAFPTPVSEIMDAGKIAVAPDDALDEGFLRKIRRKAGTALKRAISKVLGVFDAHERLVFIGRVLYEVKRTFLKLHETGHAVLPWQRDLYAVVEDSEQELDPDIADLFDREANVFAAEVLFQLDSFIEEAADEPFGIRAPLGLKNRYGASVYASVRQYVVEKSARVYRSDPESARDEGRRWLSGQPAPGCSVAFFHGKIRRASLAGAFHDTRPDRRDGPGRQAAHVRPA